MVDVSYLSKRKEIHKIIVEQEMTEEMIREKHRKAKLK